MSLLKRIFGIRANQWGPSELPQAANDEPVQKLISKWIKYGDQASALTEYAKWEKTTHQRIRSDLLLQIAEKIEQSQGWGWKAIIPFAMADNSHAVVSTAAMNLAVLMPADSKDDFRGVNYVAGMADSCGRLSTRAGSLLSGLLLLGDSRACMVVMKAWTELASEPRHVIASARSGLASRAHAIALLMWLEQEKDESVYGALAGTLGSIPRLAEKTGIVDIERSLPVYSAQEPIKLIGRYQVREFANGIRERLDRLANEESGDRVMPLVIQAWFGDPDLDALVIDTEDVDLRAQKYCSDEIKLDLNGDRFVDTKGMWMAENRTCQAAMRLMMGDKEPWNAHWFTLVRECAILGVDTSDLDIWGAFAFQAGLLYANASGEQILVPDEAKNISNIITQGMRNEGFPATYSMTSIKAAFSVLHESVGMESNPGGDPLLAVACSHKAMILGMANAMILSQEQRQQFARSIDRRPICEQLIIKSTVASKHAATTGELMVSSIVRGCAYRYKDSPREFEYFAKYFQEAEEDCGYSLDTPISTWIQDADRYSKAVCRMKPSIGRDILQGCASGDIKASRDLCGELANQTASNDAVVFCNYHWKENLGNSDFYKRSPAYIDQIITMVDLIVWRNILEKNPS